MKAQSVSGGGTGCGPRSLWMMPSITLRKPSMAWAPASPIGALDALALIFGQLALELDPGRGQRQQPLPAVALAGVLDDKALADELAEHAGEALLGDAQDAQQLADAHLRMAADEIDDAVMGATEAVARQHGVGLGGEIAIGVEEKLDSLPQLVFVRGRWGFDGF